MPQITAWPLMRSLSLQTVMFIPSIPVATILHQQDKTIYDVIRWYTLVKVGNFQKNSSIRITYMHRQLIEEVGSVSV